MSENKLINHLLKNRFKLPWRTRHPIRCAQEVKSVANRADIVYFEHTKNSEIGFVVAIETKVYNWKCALQQAYRDKLFADRVYVALPKKFSSAAISQIREFRNASVGLILVEEGNLEIYYHPPINKCKSKKHVACVHQFLSQTI